MEWQNIETAPNDEEALFWVVPKYEDETYLDSTGKPILSIFNGGKPTIEKCVFGRWSSLRKATHWLPLPPPPQEAK